MATMAGRYCCSSNSPSVLPPQRQPALGLPLQLQGTGGRGRGLRRPSLRAVASAAAEPVKAATDAEFFQPADSRPIMLFDGVCNLCNGGVRFVREHDPGRSIRYIPLQSDSGRKLLRRSGRSPDDISSVVLVEKDRSYIKSEAVLRIMEYLNLPFPQLAAFLKIAPLFVRDFAYDNIAVNRYVVFGRSETESCEIL